MKSIEFSLNYLAHAHREICEQGEKLVATVAREGTLEAAAIYANLATSFMCYVPVCSNSNNGFENTERNLY